MSKFHIFHSALYNSTQFLCKKMRSGSLLFNTQDTSLFVKIGIVFKGQCDCL